MASDHSASRGGTPPIPLKNFAGRTVNIGIAIHTVSFFFGTSINESLLIREC